MSGSDLAALLDGAPRIRAIAAVRDYLRENGVEAASADARLLTFVACGFDAMALVVDPGIALSPRQARDVAAFARRRAAGEPASRIVGRRQFWSVEVAVRPAVLDPRADSEAAIRLCLRLLPNRMARPLRVLDLGSGSGALLCALLAEYPRAFGVAVDVSFEAVRATRHNLATCGFADRAVVVQGDWAGAISGGFDLIVCNPPYIATAEIAALDLEVRGHDPHVALDGGIDGLAPYRVLMPEILRLLGDRGVAVLEHGAAQASELRALAAADGVAVVDFERDLGGRDRVLAVRREPIA